jgi:exopolysaccharide production protein ExoQ
MNRLLALSEKIFTVIAFLHYAGGPLFVVLANGASEGEAGDVNPDSPIINVIFLAIYLITFCLLLLRWKKVVPVIIKGGLIWPLFGLAIFSIFWSYSPNLTVVRVVALIGTMLFSLYLASCYTLKEQLQLFGLLFGIIVISCFFFGIFLPKYGQMSGIHAGAWRGIFSHKNGLGRIMVISAVVFYISAITFQKQRWIFWGLLAGSVILISLSKSSSSVANLLILMGLLSILPILRLNYIFMLPVIIGLSSVGIILYLLFIANATQVAGIFGKDLTLTGRTDFWPLIIDKIWEKPWLGYGFGAFWQGLDGPSAYVWNASNFKAPTAHNGYLDLCLELGLIGLSLYTIKFITSFQKALVYIRSAKTPDRYWPALLLSFMILSNLTESALILQNNFLWVMQLATFFSLTVPQLSKNADLVLEKI